MKKASLTLLALILIQVLAMAQYAGGNGRGDISGSIPGSPLNGYTVYVSASAATPGPTGYANVKAAFDAINKGTHQGTVTVTIVANTTEFESAALNATGGTANYTSVYIYPTASGLSVAGDLAAPLIDLNGADNVTIDGRVDMSGTANLIITNTSTSLDAGTSTIRFVNDASGNTVKYCTIKGSQMVTNNFACVSGIVFFSTGTSTGNDNNVIDHNNITNAADANRPLTAIFSLGTSGMENSGIIISNNNIYDFLNRGVNSQGIYFSSNTTSCTISGNSLYEVGTFVPTALAAFLAIIIQNTGTNFTVSGNYIGGSSPACSGTWIKTNAYWDNFYAIAMIVGNAAASNIQGNTIQNFSWSNSAGDHFWYGIYGQGNLNIGTLEGNTIGGSTGTGSITYTAESVNYGQFIGIVLTGTGPMDIQNNVIGSITVAGSNEATGIDFTGIANVATGSTTISKNTIGSTTTANSINLSSPSTTWPQKAFGILNNGTGDATISGNTIANMTNGTTNSSTVSTGLIHGITTLDGSNTISGNIIHDLTIANANNNAFDEVSAAGIVVTVTTTTTQSVTGNTIYNLSNTYASFAGNVIGLYYNGSTMTSTVSGNFIHSLLLNSANSAASIYGIKIDGGSASFSNNIISLGTGISTGYALYGIKLLSAGANTLNLFYNTVFIGGTATSTTSNTYALSNSNGGTNFRTYKNNIFSNSRAGGTGGKHYAISVAVLDNLTIDYNDYNAPNGVLGFLGGDKTTLSAWQSATSQDAHSQAIDPLLAHPGTATATDYMPSALTLAGTPGTGITTDYSATPDKRSLI